MIAGKYILGVVAQNLKPKHFQIIKLSYRIHRNSLNYINRSLKQHFSTVQNSFFVFNLQNQPQMLKLELQYRSQQKISIFQRQIKASTGVLDQMNIFKIFKVMQTSPYNHTSYLEFFNFVIGSIKRKSDNMLLLLATIKERMARQYKQQNNIQQTIISLEQALEILEGCMVPPLLPYYSVYRSYGLLQYELGNIDKARQVLAQTVEIMDDFVSHSDDNVSKNSYCKKQATAYNVLAVIDTGNQRKWIDKAIAIWEKYTDNKLCEIEYANSVAQNLRKLLKEDKEKGEAYYHFNLYKFETKEMKDILKKAKEEPEK